MEELIHRWRAAEQRLYPLVLVQPEAYERYLVLVRAVADELRSAQTPEELTGAFGGRASIVGTVAARAQVATEGLNLELVAEAAFSLRYREVLAEVRREEVIRRLRAASQQGAEWAVVQEAVGAAGPDMPPYDRLEMHIPSGVGLHSFVELGPEMDRPRFGVEVVGLDPQTGDRVIGAPWLAEPRTFEDRGRWEEAVEELRRRFTQLERDASP